MQMEHENKQKRKCEQKRKYELQRIYNHVLMHFDYCPELNKLTIEAIKKECQINGWETRHNIS
jgi:hypothetical protein